MAMDLDAEISRLQTLVANVSQKVLKKGEDDASKEEGTISVDQTEQNQVEIEKEFRITFLELPPKIRHGIYKFLYQEARSIYSFVPSRDGVILNLINSPQFEFLISCKVIYLESRTLWFKNATIQFKGFERFMIRSLPKLPTLVKNVRVLTLPFYFLRGMILNGVFVKFEELKKVVIDYVDQAVKLEWIGDRPWDSEVLQRVMPINGEVQLVSDLLAGWSLNIDMELKFVVRVVPVKQQDGNGILSSPVIGNLYYVLNLSTAELYHQSTKLEWA